MQQQLAAPAAQVQAQGGMQQNAQQQAQVQAQAMQNPQMMAQYQQAWARMGMPVQQMHQYWGMPPAGAGRGMPPQQMPGMPGHPSQMQPGAGAKPPGQGAQQGS